MSLVRVAALAALCITFAACTEKPQTSGTRKADTHPWAGAQASFTDPAWKAGDQASWEAQMRARAQGQNEYTRTPPMPK